MIELGQLEDKHAEFTKRNTKIVAISNDNLDDTKWVQEKFPHLIIVSDADLRMMNALEVIHKGANAHTGGDAAAPTTFLVDKTGQVRWHHRPESFMVRMTAGELLAEIDKHGTK